MRNFFVKNRRKIVNNFKSWHLPSGKWGKYFLCSQSTLFHIADSREQTWRCSFVKISLFSDHKPSTNVHKYNILHYGIYVTFYILHSSHLNFLNGIILSDVRSIMTLNVIQKWLAIWISSWFVLSLFHSFYFHFRFIIKMVLYWRLG